MSDYAGALADLHRLEAFGVRLGLDNMRAACAALGHPERAFEVLHVAGTNGKGTTAAALAALARRHGLSTGLFTSPHLVDLRERIRVDGRPIPEAALAAGWRRLAALVAERRMTFFEATTLLALEWFAAEAVDLAVLEVGLGGRLDATNVVRPRLAVVTNVARDHEAHLGRDLASIAREKAGIFKPGVPALVGEPGPAEVRAVFASAAAEAGAPLGFLPDEAAWAARPAGPGECRLDYRSTERCLEGLVLPLPAEPFAADVALALRAWERAALAPLDPAAVRAAIAGTAPAGRGEWHEVDGAAVLFDVAHNPAALGRLAAVLAALPGRSALVLGMLADKAWPAMLDAVRPVAARAWLCGLATASEGRRLDARAAASGLAGRPWVAWAGSVAAGLAAARAAVAAGAAERIVVSGSFHTVGEALVALGLATAGEPYERRPAPTAAEAR